MSSSSEIAGVFDRAADTYDAVGVDWFKPIAVGLVRELAVQPGERVVDIGCGRGAALLPLARAAGPSGSVLGIDLSARMVELTAHDVAEFAQVTVRVGDANAPGLPVGSVDVIASSLVLFFLRDPGAALATWSELLVPGGRLGVTTFGQSDERWKALDAIFAPHLAQSMLDARTSGQRGPFASDAGVEEFFGNAGLTQLRTVHNRVRALFKDPEQLLEFTWSHGQRAMWEAVSADKRETVREQVIEFAEQVLDDDGQLSLTQDVRYTIGRRPAEGGI